MSAALDAMILIWGLQKPHHKGKAPTNPDIAELRRRSRLLLETLSEEGETVIVPAIALSEVLLGIDPREHGTFIAEAQERFFLPPYDLHCASLAAQLWQATRELPKHEQPARTVLKSDVMIVATAKVAGADVLYSHEKSVRTLAERAGMKAKDLPTHSENMFVDDAVRREMEGTEPNP